MQFIDKYSKYALLLAIIVIIYLIWSRPGPVITDDEYKTKAKLLQKEKEELLRQRDSIMASLDKNMEEIIELKQRDSLHLAKMNENKVLITIINKQHEKNLAAINRTSSDDLKRIYADLKD